MARGPLGAQRVPYSPFFFGIRDILTSPLPSHVNQEHSWERRKLASEWDATKMMNSAIGHIWAICSQNGIHNGYKLGYRVDRKDDWPTPSTSFWIQPTNHRLQVLNLKIGRLDIGIFLLRSSNFFNSDTTDVEFILRKLVDREPTSVSVAIRDAF